MGRFQPTPPAQLFQLERIRLTPDLPLAEVPAVLCGEFAKVPQGLYVFLFANRMDVDVYDNNKGREKIVVHRRGLSMKPGKFEKGFAVRLDDYNNHLHRTHPGRATEWVLGECFASGYLLDLSEPVGRFRAPARIFERYWIEGVNAYLAEHKLLAERPIKQLGRAEWRYLHAARWCPAVEERLRSYLGEVAGRIFDMMRVGDPPKP